MTRASRLLQIADPFLSFCSSSQVASSPGVQNSAAMPLRSVFRSHLPYHQSPGCTPSPLAVRSYLPLPSTIRSHLPCRQSVSRTFLPSKGFVVPALSSTNPSHLPLHRPLHRSFLAINDQVAPSSSSITRCTFLAIIVGSRLPHMSSTESRLPRMLHHQMHLPCDSQYGVHSPQDIRVCFAVGYQLAASISVSGLYGETIVTTRRAVSRSPHLLSNSRAFRKLSSWSCFLY